MTVVVISPTGVQTEEDDDSDFYDPDCPACLRHRPHSRREHEAALRRNYLSSIDLPIDTWNDW